MCVTPSQLKVNGRRVKGPTKPAPLSPVATAVPLLILEISFHFSFKAICILWFFAMQAALQVIFMEGLQGASGNQKRPFGQPGWEKMIKKMSDWVAGMAILLKQSV